MQSQGSIINTQYFDNIIDQINGIEGPNACAELQSCVTDVFAQLQGLTDGINAELAIYLPMLALLTPPSANLGAIVTFLTNLITAYLTPISKPAITYVAQLAQLTAKIAELTSAINSAESRITSCSITIPPIT